MMWKQMQALLHEDMTWAEIARMFNVSTPTLYQFINNYNLKIPQFSDISDDDLVDVITQIKKNHLAQQDLKVQRWR